MTRKRTIFLLVAVLIIAWVLTLFSSEAPDGSTYSTRPNGSAALFETLVSLGFNVERFRHAFPRLKEIDSNSALVVITPSSEPLTSGLKDWIEKGNTLVYFARQNAGKDPIFDELDIDREEAKNLSPEKVISRVFSSEGEFTCPLSDGDLCPEVSRVSDTSVLPFQPSPRFKTIRVSNGLVTGVFIRIGKGTAWLFADPAPVLNEHVDKNDNFKMLYAIFKRVDRVFFDEFHHGFVAPATGGTSQKLGLLLTLGIYFLVVLVMAILSRAIRFGPPRQVLDFPATASTEFIRALGVLYSQKRVGGVLEQYVLAWRKRAADLIGGATNRSAEQIVDIFQSRGMISNEEAHGVRSALATLASEQRLELSEVESATLVLERCLTGMAERA